VLELMGHKAGWLALGAGIAGGADVILIPEMPYDVESVAEAILSRSRSGRGFSIVAVAEGAMSQEAAATLEAAKAEARKERERQEKKKDKDRRDGEPEKAAAADTDTPMAGNSLRLAQQLESLTGLESRVTILGYLQRGGIPSAADRLLATRLGTACADLIQQGIYGVMVAARGDSYEPVPLRDVVGKRLTVPRDHYWIESARSVGTCLGD
jgi:ATP-dependent phosphofructokinase / diphosphate-dependent phosphofructokinase